MESQAGPRSDVVNDLENGPPLVGAAGRAILQNLDPTGQVARPLRVGKTPGNAVDTVGEDADLDAGTVDVLRLAEDVGLDDAVALRLRAADAEDRRVDRRRGGKVIQVGQVGDLTDRAIARDQILIAAHARDAHAPALQSAHETALILGQRGADVDQDPMLIVEGQELLLGKEAIRHRAGVGGHRLLIGVREIRKDL